MKIQGIPSPGDGLRLHLNENTGGCSPRVIEAIRTLTPTDIAAYPDYKKAVLTCAEYFQVNPEELLLTNGLDEGILMVTPASTSPDITERGYELVFRTIGLDSMQGPVAANYLISQKPERVAVVHDKQQYGEGIATAVRDTLEEAGVEVAMFEGITAGAKDFSSLVTKLRQADVDYVYYGGYHPELGLILRQAQQADLDATFMGPEGVGNKDINTIAGEAAEGLLVTLPPSFDEKDENQELVQAFEEKGEDPSGPFVLTSYTAVQLIADGIEAAESTDPFDVAEALRAGTFQTPIGTVEYDNKGDMESFEFVVYEWHSDGSKTPVN